MINLKLPDGSNSVSDIQNYFECIKKKHGEQIDNLSVRIYVYRIELRLKLKKKILTLETMKLFGSTENKTA